MKIETVLRLLIRESIANLLEGSAGTDYTVSSLSDIVIGPRLINSAIHPVFIGESLEASQAFNAGERFNQFWISYMDLYNSPQRFRISSPVRYTRGDWVIIPSLYGKDPDFGDLMQVSSFGITSITGKRADLDPYRDVLFNPDRVREARAAQAISPTATEFGMPYVTLAGKGDTRIARAFIYKIAGPSKSRVEAEEIVSNWKDRQNMIDAAAARREEKAAKRSERGMMTTPAIEPPMPKPSGPSVIRRRPGEPSPAAPAPAKKELSPRERAEQAARLRDLLKGR